MRHDLGRRTDTDSGTSSIVIRGSYAVAVADAHSITCSTTLAIDRPNPRGLALADAIPVHATHAKPFAFASATAAGG